MTRTKTIAIALAANLVLSSLAAAVDSTTTAPAASPVSEGRPSMNGRLERFLDRAADRLDLTDAQLKSLRQIFAHHESEIRPLMDRSRAERKALRELTAAEPLDEAALETQASRIGETTKALTIARAHLHADLRTVLTPEQVDKLMKARQHLAQRQEHGRPGPGGADR